MLHVLWNAHRELQLNNTHRKKRLISKWSNSWWDMNESASSDWSYQSSVVDNKISGNINRDLWSSWHFTKDFTSRQPSPPYISEKSEDVLLLIKTRRRNLISPNNYTESGKHIRASRFRPMTSPPPPPPPPRAHSYTPLHFSSLYRYTFETTYRGQQYYCESLKARYKDRHFAIS